MSDFQRKFTSAKLNLAMDKRTMFYSAMLLGMRQVFDNPKIERAATDGTTIYLKTDWFSSIDLEEAVGVLAHEVGHVVHDHIFRAKNLNSKYHNYAADYLLNNELDHAGIKLPYPRLMDHKYDGWSLLEVYDHLLKDQVDFPEIEEDIIVVPDHKVPAAKAAIDVLLTQAAMSARMGGGQVPDVVERHLEKLEHPEIDWETALYGYAGEFAQVDYSWSKLNTAYLPDLFLPSLCGERIDEIAFAVDSSGSVTDKEFNSFRSAMARCREIMEPSKTTIVDFTTQINNVHELGQFDLIEDIKFDGWGGTDLYPVIEFFKERNPTVLIVFSDLDCEPVDTPPDYPVIWICVNAPEAYVNFGKLIHYSTPRW